MVGDSKNKGRTLTPWYPGQQLVTLTLFPTQSHTEQGLLKENLLEKASEMHGIFGDA